MLAVAGEMVTLVIGPGFTVTERCAGKATGAEPAGVNEAANGKTAAVSGTDTCA